MRRSPWTQGRAKHDKKKHTKTRQSPKKQDQNKIAAAPKHRRFKGFGRKCGEAHGAESKKTKEGNKIQLSLKVWGGFWGLACGSFLPFGQVPVHRTRHFAAETGGAGRRRGRRHAAERGEARRGEARRGRGTTMPSKAMKPSDRR